MHVFMIYLCPTPAVLVPQLICIIYSQSRHDLWPEQMATTTRIMESIFMTSHLHMIRMALPDLPRPRPRISHKSRRLLAGTPSRCQLATLCPLPRGGRPTSGLLLSTIPFYDLAVTCMLLMRQGRRLPNGLEREEVTTMPRRALAAVGRDRENGSGGISENSFDGRTKKQHMLELP